MTNEDPNAVTSGGPPRRSSRQGVGGSPVASTLSIVLAVVAVVVGFLILNNITDDGGGAADPGDGVDTGAGTTAPATSDVPATTQPPATTEPPLVTEGATVIVANASGIGGSAGRMTDTLELAGFTTGAPTNSTAGQLEASVVYYDPGIAAAEDVANSVARVMGGLTVETVPDPVPVDSGTLGDAGVLVMLGTNEADQTLEQMSGESAATGETPSTGTAPDVAGSTETTTG